ncbi:hypothetical protein DL766_005870 [Monosporascus sp. MC13-8B]|uniref:Uncharacterized protein n=1 Tax=Monosporascus cannonballus TaxID=155416 RepID=A0ABY0H6C2_9PEZI|nr:hypothetical protein DL762_005138 [Monosporascus cannonballus]RYO91497.1 hypothetical protein DL763_004961 [Monosporascus cannonballus]RYP28439.1 hypothetical protein DL766_005870 [Monosporascus sp. MC13-8B]
MASSSDPEADNRNGTHNDNSINAMPSNEEQRKGQQMAKDLEKILIRQNHEQQGKVEMTDPGVYDARNHSGAEVPEYERTL